MSSSIELGTFQSNNRREESLVHRCFAPISDTLKTIPAIGAPRRQDGGTSSPIFKRHLVDRGSKLKLMQEFQKRSPRRTIAFKFSLCFSPRANVLGCLILLICEETGPAELRRRCRCDVLEFDPKILSNRQEADQKVPGGHKKCTQSDTVKNQYSSSRFRLAWCDRTAPHGVGQVSSTVRIAALPAKTTER